MSGEISDTRKTTRVKGKVYKMCGVTCCGVMCGMEMTRFSLGVTRMNRIRSEYIRVTAKGEPRLTGFGHVQRRERMKLPGRRKTTESHRCSGGRAEGWCGTRRC